jgi:hypothetical protein
VGSTAGKFVAIGIALIVHATLIVYLGSAGVLKRLVLPSSPAPAPVVQPVPAPARPAPRIQPPAPAPAKVPPARPQRVRASRDPGLPALFSYEAPTEARQAPPAKAPRAAELQPARDVLERALSRPDGGGP